MKTHTPQNDNWSLLLGDLGIEEPQVEQQSVDTKTLEAEPATTAEVIERAKPVETASSETVPSRGTTASETLFDGFGAGLLDDVPERQSVQTASEQVVARAAATASTEREPNPELDDDKPKGGKKRFFDRFPKMNLFGSAPKESLESVVGAAKSPSLSGKSFTSNTLEKVPVTKERSERKKSGKSAAPTEEATKSDDRSPWSMIASQVDSLSTPTDHRETKSAKREEKNGDQQADRRRGRRQLPSMFADPDIESEESAKLKGLMAEGKRGGDQDAEERLSSMFGTKSSTDSAPVAPDRREEGERAGRHVRGRRNRDEDVRRREPIEADPFAAFHAEQPDALPAEPRRSARAPRRETAESRREERREPPVMQNKTIEKSETRGRRGSRYIDRAALEAGHDSSYLQERDLHEREDEETRPRGRGRKTASDRSGREEQVQERASFERDNFERDSEDRVPSAHYDFAHGNKNMPSWDDTIRALVDANIARRGQRSQRGGGRR